VNAKRFLAELKQRNVYRAAALYGMAAWLLVQIATQVFPFFDVPSWAVRFVIVALVIGFPIAMLLAWIFELTPEGIVRTDDVDPAGAIGRSAGRILNFAIIGALLLIIAFLIFQRQWRNAAAGEIPPKADVALASASRDRELFRCAKTSWVLPSRLRYVPKE